MITSIEYLATLFFWLVVSSFLDQGFLSFSTYCSKNNYATQWHSTDEPRAQWVVLGVVNYKNKNNKWSVCDISCEFVDLAWNSTLTNIATLTTIHSHKLSFL